MNIPRLHVGLSICCLTALILGAAHRIAIAQCASASFDGSRSYAALGGNQTGAPAVAVGDFDRDGRPDLAAASPENDGVSVFLNRGDGTFGRPTLYAAGSHPNGVAVADFDGDGALDLITANGGGNSVSVLLGSGDGGFQSPRNSAAGVIPLTLAIGDFNHDGKPDAAVGGGTAAIGTHQLWVLLGNGDGTFQPPIVNTTADYQYFVVAGDFNRDGDLDLVAGSQNQIWILLGNGDGTFKPPVDIATQGGGPYGNAAAVGDLNQDHFPDLAIANSQNSVDGSPGTVSVLLGNGNGTFLPPITVAAGAIPNSVAVADLDGDGRLDLAVANAGDARVAVSLGKGDGTFQSPASYPVGANLAASLAVADFSGDGSPDLAVSSAFTDDVSVLLSAGGGKFHSVARYHAGLQPYALVTADFNRDGRLDLAVANSGSTASLLPGTISILLGDGDGSFGAPASYDAGKLPTFIATEDFDRDGALDLAVVNHQSANVAIFLGHGDGAFEAAVEYPVGSNPIGIVVADFNGDGRSDLATGSASAGGTGQASILPGNGDGTFRPAINSTVPGNGITAVAGGDFDGDGQTDLAVANYYSGDVVIMRGGGDGTFQPAGSLPAFGPSSVAVGDFDADGKADLAVGNFGNVKISVFLGSGDGAFRAAGSYEVGNFPITIAVADFNGDSRADLAVANLNDHYVSILQGNGDGTFRDALDYGSGKGPSALAVGDFNRDGKPDLAMTGFWFNDVSVLLNDCAAGALTVLEPGQAAGPEITALAPNPARADARVEYAIPVAMVVDLSVFDAEGRRVAALFSGPQGPGRHSQWVRGGMLPPGTYWCRLAAGGVTRSRALIVLR